jgi:hypothetical protein
VAGIQTVCLLHYSCLLRLVLSHSWCDIYMHIMYHAFAIDFTACFYVTFGFSRSKMNIFSSYTLILSYTSSAYWVLSVKFRTRRNFEVFITVSLKMADCWDVAPCSVTDTDRRFRGPSCLHHQAVSFSQKSLIIYQTMSSLSNSNLNIYACLKKTVL